MLDLEVLFLPLPQVLVQVTKGTSTTALQWKITDVGGQVVGSPAAGAMTHGGDTYRFCIRSGKTEFLAIDSSGSGWSGGSYKVTLVSTGKGAPQHAWVQGSLCSRVLHPIRLQRLRGLLFALSSLYPFNTCCANVWVSLEGLACGDLLFYRLR